MRWGDIQIELESSVHHWAVRVYQTCPVISHPIIKCVYPVASLDALSLPGHQHPSSFAILFKSHTSRKSQKIFWLPQFFIFVCPAPLLFRPNRTRSCSKIFHVHSIWQLCPLAAQDTSSGCFLVFFPDVNRDHLWTPSPFLRFFQSSKQCLNDTSEQNHYSPAVPLKYPSRFDLWHHWS